MGSVGTVWMLVVVMAGCALLSVAAEDTSSSAAPAADACPIYNCPEGTEPSFCATPVPVESCTRLVLTEADKVDLLRVVNLDRQKAAAGNITDANGSSVDAAKRLFKLKWSPNGARAAENYATTCPSERDPCGDIPRMEMVPLVVKAESSGKTPKEILDTVTANPITKNNVYTVPDDNLLKEKTRLIFLLGAIKVMGCAMAATAADKFLYCNFGPEYSVYSSYGLYNVKATEQCEKKYKQSNETDFNLLCEFVEVSSSSPDEASSTPPGGTTLHQNKTSNATKSAAVHHSGLPHMYVAAVVLYSLTQP